MIDLEKEPVNNIRYLKSKVPELAFYYDEIAHQAHHKAFTVAKITRLDLLSDIRDALAQNLKDGVNFERFKAELKPILKQKGWFGKTEVINEDTGEVKTINVNSSRLRNIFETNMRTGYAKGRYEAQMRGSGEYLRYSAVIDQFTRPEHRSIHGTVLPKDDPFWNVNYPPNGWGCRCKVRAYTKKQLDKKKIKPNSSAPDSVADKDWNYNPGKVDTAAQVWSDKVAALKKAGPQANARERWVPELYDAAASQAVISVNDFKRWFKKPSQSYPVSSLHPSLKEKFKAKKSSVSIDKDLVKNGNLKYYEYLILNRIETITTGGRTISLDGPLGQKYEAKISFQKDGNMIESFKMVGS